MRQVFSISLLVIIFLTSFQAAQSVKIRPATDTEKEELGIVGVVFPTNAEMKRCSKVNKNSDIIRYNFVLAQTVKEGGAGFGQQWNSNTHEPVAYLHPTDALTSFYLSPAGESGTRIIQFECARDNEGLSFAPIGKGRVVFEEDGELTSSSFNAGASSNPARVYAARTLFVTKAKKSRPQITITEGGFNVKGTLNKAAVASLKLPANIENVENFKITNNSAQSANFKFVLRKGKKGESIEGEIGANGESDVDFDASSGTVRISISSPDEEEVTDYDFDITFPDLGSL